MMEPGRPTSSDLRDFPRRVRDADEEVRAQNEQLIGSRQLIDRERLRYRDLFDFAPDAYLVTDAQGTIREANIAAEKLFRVEPKSLAGKPVHTFFGEGSRREYRKQLDRLCDSERVDDWELWINARSGQRVPVAISLSRSSSRDENKVGYRWILRDVTRQKGIEDALREVNRSLELRVASRTTQLAAANLKKDQLIYSERKSREEAEVANRVKSDFLALLSHEFRTPLQAIFGYTELLEREIHGPLNDSQRQDLKRIQQSQQHLLGLITTILDFARLESGHGLEAQMGAVTVNDVLCNMEGFISPQLESKNLGYSYSCEDKSLMANADGAKLEQIVLNLLANAIKFTESGGAISLECAACHDHIQIHVRDTGIGIPPNKLEAIFEPFVQIRARGMSIGGTGLGLPISRRLAVAMGGELTATSVEGSGSTFTLVLRSLPAETIGDAEPEVSARAESVPTKE